MLRTSFCGTCIAGTSMLAQEFQNIVRELFAEVFYGVGSRDLAQHDSELELLIRRVENRLDLFQSILRAGISQSRILDDLRLSAAVRYENYASKTKQLNRGQTVVLVGSTVQRPLLLRDQPLHLITRQALPPRDMGARSDHIGDPVR